jgi:hypothetical protein
MSNPAEANRTALDRLKSAIKAKRLADESLVRTKSTECPDQSDS